MTLQTCRLPKVDAPGMPVQRAGSYRQASAAPSYVIICSVNSPCKISAKKCGGKIPSSEGFATSLDFDPPAPATAIVSQRTTPQGRLWRPKSLLLLHLHAVELEIVPVAVVV